MEKGHGPGPSSRTAGRVGLKEAGMKCGFSLIFQSNQVPPPDLKASENTSGSGSGVQPRLLCRAQGPWQPPSLPLPCALVTVGPCTRSPGLCANVRSLCPGLVASATSSFTTHPKHRGLTRGPAHSRPAALRSPPFSKVSSDRVPVSSHLSHLAPILRTGWTRMVPGTR